jgi:hypothetical protein
VWVMLCFLYSPRVAALDAIDVLGYVRQPTYFKSLPAHRIARFEPHSPLPSAGIEVGNLVVDPPRGTLLPGESVQLQIHNGSGLRTLAIRSDQRGQLSTVLNSVLRLCLNALGLVLGVTIVCRRRHDVAALAIGCALLLAVIAEPPNIFPVGLLGRLSTLFEVGPAGDFAVAALAYSVLTFEAGYRSRARPYLVRALIGFCAIFGALNLIFVAPYTLGWIWLPPLPVPILSLGGVAALTLCVFAFVDAWRHVQGEPRQRLRWVSAAMAIALAGYSVAVFFSLGVFGENTTTALVFATLGNAILVSGGIITLTYAVLRHRVIDVGFVISRTLVFAVFTGLLLVLFAAAEWLVDHFVHFRQRESSVLLDGAIAVAMYLAFHRVRHGVERLVEGVFFRASRAKQLELQHFLQTAPNFSDPDALAGALLKAVDAYAGSRGSGIYRRDKTGRFVLEKSTLDELPRALAADAEVIIELKTSRKPYQFSRLGFELAALALPVVRRAELVGFMAVSAKSDRTLYRPDEIENLVRTVQQVSSDLYALQLESFQQQYQVLEQQVDALRDQLRSLGRASPSLAKTL